MYCVGDVYEGHVEGLMTSFGNIADPGTKVGGRILFVILDACVYLLL